MKHFVKLSNVTNLYEHQMHRHPDFFYVLWYRYECTFDTDLAKIDDKAKQLVDDILVKFGFPDYAKIAHFMIGFSVEKVLTADDYEPDDEAAVAVVVPEDSIFAKGNETPDETGFVKLFTLFFDGKQLRTIQLNANAMYPKVPVMYGPKQYPAIEAINTVHGSCSICLTDGNLVNTDCGHMYHLDCLRCLPKFNCPSCGNDLTDLLKTQGVTDQELSDRIADHAMHDQLQEHLQMISTIDLAKLDDNSDLLKLTRIFLKTLELSSGDVKPLHDLVALLHSGGSDKFIKVANFHKSEQPHAGLFVYYQTSSLGFAVPMFQRKYPSDLKWYYTAEIEDTPFKKMVQDKLSTIGKSKDHYVLGIIIDNTYTVHIIHRDEHKKVPPITYVDRLRSVLTLSPYVYASKGDPAHNDESIAADVMIMSMTLINLISQEPSKKNKKRMNKRKLRKRK